MRTTRLLHTLTLVLAATLLTACETMRHQPDTTENEELDDTFKVMRKRSGTTAKPTVRSVGALQTQLGMNRKPSDLGYSEKSFNPCNYGLSNDCSDQYLTVIHFQLLCRDSEGTVSNIPLSLTPINSPQISWSLAGQNGGAPTDRNGYGHLTVVSERPLRQNRLILRKGPHYVGISVDDVTKVVLPKNWCRGNG